MSQLPFIKASEIGEFVYCKRAWWLRFSGKVTEITPKMVLGTEKHDALATELTTVQRFLKFSWILIGVGIILILILGVIFTFT